MLKLCVGVDCIADLEARIVARLDARKARGEPAEQFHTTRMVPRRMEELLDGGSLYWVIKGQVSARQPILDIRPFTDTDGISRCNIVLEPVVMPVQPRRCRAFQGWRYLPDKEKPVDLRAGGIDLGHMPEAMQRELRELGLL